MGIFQQFIHLANSIMSVIRSSMRILSTLILIIFGILFFVIILFFLMSDLPLLDKLENILTLFLVSGIIALSVFIRTYPRFYLQNTPTTSNMSKKERVACNFFRYGKFFLFISIIYLFFETIFLLYEGSKTQGLILNSHIEQSKNSSATCYKMVEYNVNNKTYTISESYMLTPLGTCQAQGTKLIVSYNSSHPEFASSQTLYESFFMPIILLIFANVLMLISWLAKQAEE